jgi:glycosyltransferase involved in cell wall biosynthesis
MRPERISVRHYGPGGRENGGGIGRLIGYVVDEANHSGADHAVRDTRGPDWSPARSAIHLARALLAMTGDAMLARQRVQHIHFAGRGSTLRKLIVARWARALRCRYILHLHDYDYGEDFARRPAWLKSRIRAMVQSADRMIVLGERDRRTAIEVLHVSPGRVSIFHNCVPDPGERLRGPRNAVRILFLGRLSERKGVSDLLEALASPALADLPWRAVLAGDGPVAQYRAFAEKLGILGSVELPGWLDADQTADLCRASDILVLPSYAEGMAMAVLEGLAHGLAVVTTRVGAHEEAITDGVNGLFVPVGDPAALAATLRELVSDPRKRDDLGRNGRNLFLSRFNMSIYGTRLETIYAAAIMPVGRKQAQGISLP